MNTLEEQLIAYMAGIDAVLDQLLINDESHRAKLKTIAAEEMGAVLGKLFMNRITKNVEKLKREGGDK